jgi:malonate-semialdehyde dehydrogenase (acetylating)/methylmalonate-semialdehyde dehydrogenase
MVALLGGCGILEQFQNRDTRTNDSQEGFFLAKKSNWQMSSQGTVVLDLLYWPELPLKEMVRMSEVLNFIGGKWRAAGTDGGLELANPATGESLGRSGAGGSAEIAAAVEAGVAAFPGWRATPVGDRIQFLFRLKALLETHLDELARLVTIENGKTLGESRGEIRRGIENVEVACGMPVLMQGYSLEDIAPGIDEIMVRQPLGVVGVITPFNFPLMIPLWFLPYAIASGNTVVLKPSDRVPFAVKRLVELIAETGLPAGVVNLVQGGKAAVDALLDHPEVRAISFVGSTAVAQYVYTRGSAAGKRVQCQGGAKNHVVVLPDAEQETTTKIIADSAFGCAGQRCLAVSVTVTVGDAQKWFRDRIVDAAASLKVGNGLDETVQMGPVITAASQERIKLLIEKGASDGARPVAGGSARGGTFIAPTVLDGLPATSGLMETEIFGPVLSLVHAESVEEAVAMIDRSAYGNASSIFTSSGSAARKFRNSVTTGNVGVNIGVPAPMAYFPFSGWKGSFFGVMHAQGRDAVEFFTDKKVIVERWPKEWSRKF